MCVHERESEVCACVRVCVCACGALRRGAGADVATHGA